MHLESITVIQKDDHSRRDR